MIRGRGVCIFSLSLSNTSFYFTGRKFNDDYFGVRKKLQPVHIFFKKYIRLPLIRQSTFLHPKKIFCELWFLYILQSLLKHSFQHEACHSFLEAVWLLMNTLTPDKALIARNSPRLPGRCKCKKPVVLPLSINHRSIFNKI